ncbi:MAG: trigger factor [Fretibacterium sp.]|nr:trigger factor [Fretibacterium sp.]
MRTELLGQEKNIIRVKVEFEAEDFAKHLAKTVRDFSNQVNIPGFRKGHAPRRVIEMRFGLDTLHTETLENMLPGAIQQVVDDYELDIIDDPALSLGEIKEGEPVSCELTFEVMPEVELSALEEIEVERELPAVPDEKLNPTIEDLRRNACRFEPVEREVCDSDVVEVTFLTQVLEADREESTPQKIEIDLADEAVRREVREALLGKSAGSKVETEFDVEPDYQDPSVAGKRVRYKMTVEMVRERVLPDLDQDFFKKVLGEDTPVETEHQFREEVRKRMHERIADLSHARARDEAVSILTERSSLEVPETLVNRQVAILRKEDEKDAQERFGVSLEEILSNASTREGDYLQELRTKARTMVRRSLVLDALGKRDDISVSREELEAELDRRASMMGVTKEVLRGAILRDRNAMMRLADSLRYDKIAEHVMSRVKVKDVEKLSAPQQGVESSEQ